MRAGGWIATASGVLVASATVVVGVNSFALTGSISSSGGTASATPLATSTATPCNKGNANSNCHQGSDNKTFTVTGSVTQLVPGALRTLSLSVKNNASQAINVRTLTVQAADARNALGVVLCPASNLLLGTSGTPGSGSISPTGLQIAGGATGTRISFPVRLSAAAGNGCKSVTWQLTYAGSADQA